jgi:hypothetical protein
MTKPLSTRGCFRGVKLPEHDFDNSLVSGVKAKMVYVHSPKNIYMAWSLRNLVDSSMFVIKQLR